MTFFNSRRKPQEENKECRFFPLKISIKMWAVFFSRKLQIQGNQVAKTEQITDYLMIASPKCDKNQSHYQRFLSKEKKIGDAYPFPKDNCLCFQGGTGALWFCETIRVRMRQKLPMQSWNSEASLRFGSRRRTWNKNWVIIMAGQPTPGPRTPPPEIRV